MNTEKMFLMIATVFMAVLYSYVESRLVYFLALSSFFKNFISFFLLLGVLNIWVVFYGQIRFPVWVCRLFSVAQVFLVYLVFALILLDVLRLFQIQSLGLSIFFLGICMLLSLYAVQKAFQLPSIRKIDIISEQLPDDWQPLTIAQLSDFHIGHGFHQAWLEKVVCQTNDLKPDVIVITGDSIDGTVKQLSSELIPLKELKAKEGVYMVFGNHEYYYDTQKWAIVFQKMGITLLNNENVLLFNGKNQFILGGADWKEHLKFDDIQRVITKTFSRTDECLPRILLAHYPLAFLGAVQNHILLQLSGHTHGGMTFPIDWLVRLLNGGYVKGLYQKGTSFLYVTEGTGLWGGFPARLGTQNEIVLLTVLKK